MRHKAFTLIELLVVIAIIAILAAILFPVFAQAKMAAKKAAHISNYKQTGTAVQIYLADHDDQMPQAQVRRPDGTWFNGLMPTPETAILTAPWNTPERIHQASNHWSNSLQPYMKNRDLFEMNAAKGSFTVAGEVFSPTIKASKMGLNFNGYLHTYSATALENVAVVPLFWNVQSINSIGRALSTPTMTCAGTFTGCYFNPTGNPNSTAGSTNGTYFVYDFATSVWQYDRKGIVVRADSSTKALANGTTLNPQFVSWPGKLLDPWAAVNGPSGTPASLWPCDSTFNGQGAGSAWCYFRPDRKE